MEESKLPGYFLGVPVGHRQLGQDQLLQALEQGPRQGDQEARRDPRQAPPRHQTEPLQCKQ